MKCLLFIVLIHIFSIHHAFGQLWKSYADSARQSAVKKELQSAANYYLHSKSILQRDSIDTRALAAVNDSLGNLYIILKKYKAADTAYLEAKAIREKISGVTGVDYASSCYNLGYLYTQYLDRYKQAILLLDTALNIWEHTLGKESIPYAKTCNYLATCKNNLGDTESALKLYLSAKEVFTTLLGEENIEVAKTLHNISTVYIARGNFLNAEAYEKESLKAFEKCTGTESMYYLTVKVSLANNYYQEILNEKALPILLEAREPIKNKFGIKSDLYVYTSDILGQVYREMGNYNAAEDIFLQGRKYREETSGKETQWYAANSFNLAKLYYYIGQYPKSEQLFLESKGIRERMLGKNNGSYIATCTSLAELYIKLKQFQKAEDLLLEARKLRELVDGKNSSYILDCVAIGNLYIDMHEYAKAEKILLEGKDIAQLLTQMNRLSYSDIYFSLGILYSRLKNYPESKRYFLEAKRVMEGNGGNENIATVQIYKNLAESEWNQGRYDSASHYLSFLPGLQKTQVQNIFKFTSETEKQSYLLTIKELSDFYFSFMWQGYSLKQVGEAYEYAYSGKNLILGSVEQLNRTAAGIRDSSIRNSYSEWVDTKKKLAVYYTNKLSDPENISQLEKKANDLEKTLASSTAAIALHDSPEDIKWNTVRSKLSPTDAGIEFISFNYYAKDHWTDSICYAALVMRGDKPRPDFINLFEQGQLDSVLGKNAGKVSDQVIADLYSRGAFVNNTASVHKSLYDLIWKPLDKYLTGISRIYFSVSGSLNKIAFTALPVNDKSVLSDKYKLVQLNSTAAMARNLPQTFTTSDKFYLVGGIKYDMKSPDLSALPGTVATNGNSRSLPDDLVRSGSWNYLPGTEKEVMVIEETGRKKHYSIQTSTGASATEEMIKSMDGDSSVDVLHIATHGFFFPDPKRSPDEYTGTGYRNQNPFKTSRDPLFRSGLLFAGANAAWTDTTSHSGEDGILTSYEVSNLYLKNTKLVVLSACETALGDIRGSEGVYGLQRAFKMAGADYLLMSLWKVPDEETSEFMIGFYGNLFSKQSVSNAFFNAQSSMKMKYRAEPYKWAAWVLIR